MKNTLLIKVCGLRDEKNIQAVSSLNPNFMGFIHYPKSKRFVGADFELPKSIPSSIAKVAVLVNEPIEKAVQIYQKGYQYLQLHGNEMPEYCKELQQKNSKLIKAFGVSETFDFSILNDYLPFVEYFLFDTQTPIHGGSGIKFNWDILQNYKFNKPFLLSGGITKEDAQTLLEFQHPQLIGVDINSGFELSPALKNIADLEEFFEKLRR